MVTEPQKSEAEPKPKAKAKAKAKAAPKPRAKPKPKQKAPAKVDRKPSQTARPRAAQASPMTPPEKSMRDRPVVVLGQLAQLALVVAICFFGARRNVMQDGVEGTAMVALALLWTAWPILFSG